MPFEIRDEGQFLFARLFGVLSHADLLAMVKEVERLEDAWPVPKNRICDMTSLEEIDVDLDLLNARRLLELPALKTLSFRPVTPEAVAVVPLLRARGVAIRSR